MHVIILTKSEKYRNYCVAGINEENGDWIRLESENAELKGALTDQDLLLASGNDETARILDVVDVNFKYDVDENNSYFQPENKIIYSDGTHRMRLIRHSSWGEVFNLHPIEKKKTLLGVKPPRIYVADDFFRNKCSYPKSLILIEAENFVIHPIKEGRNHPKAEFDYRNRENTYLHYSITITDPEYVENVPEDKKMGRVFLIVSLGAALEDQNNNHYLLIAKIIDRDQLS